MESSQAFTPSQWVFIKSILQMRPAFHVCAYLMLSFHLKLFRAMWSMQSVAHFLYSAIVSPKIFNFGFGLYEMSKSLDNFLYSKPASPK